MEFITYQGAPLALLLAFPNWEHEMQVDLELPANIDKAISALESRRAFAATPRYTLSYSAYFESADESTRYRLFLTRLKGELVAVPMWCDQTILSVACNAGAMALQKEADNPVRFGAEWIIINDDGSQFEIVAVGSLVGNTLNLHSGTQYAWGVGTFCYPLLFGRFAERPKPEWITDETTTSTIKIKENSAYAHRLAPFGGAIPTVGTTVPNFSALPIWNIYPKFDKPIDSTETDVLYKSIGFSREDSQYVYQQSNRRTLELPFYQATRADIAAIERLFVDRRGQNRSFLVPTFRDDMRLNSDVIAGGSTITIEETELTDPDRPVNPGDPYLALVTFNLSDLSQPPAVEPVKWISADSTGTILTTDEPIGQSHPMNATLVSHLLLARFTDPKLSWVYKTDGIATSTIKFLELPNEYVTGSVTVTPPIFGYRFTHQLPVPQYFLFTSFENTVPIASGLYAGNYVPAPFSHGTLKTSVKLDNEKLDIDSFKFDGNPLMLFLPFQLEAPLWLDVLEFNGDDLTQAPTVIFTGEVWEVDPLGVELKASCLIFGRHMERNFPNYNVQKVCNYAVYSPEPRCGVNKAAFAVTGNILSLVGSPPTEVHLNAGHALAADYLSIGFVETGAGANFERRTIMHSEPLPAAAGQKLILNFPLLHAVVGQPLSAYPGCNGSKETCAGVFNNLTRMGAFPFVPDLNPTIKAMNAKNAGGGKK